MTKENEINDTRSRLNKARPNELIFVLLGRDRAAPEIIRAWAKLRVRLGDNQKDDPQILEANQLATAMEVAARQWGQAEVLRQAMKLLRDSRNIDTANRIEDAFAELLQE